MNIKTLPMDTVITFRYLGKTKMSNGMPTYHWQVFIGDTDITQRMTILRQRIVNDAVVTNEFYFPLIMVDKLSEINFGLEGCLQCDLLEAEDLYTPIITDGYPDRYDLTIEYFRQRMKDENYPTEAEQVISEEEVLTIVNYGCTFEKRYAFDVLNSKGVIVNEVICNKFRPINSSDARLLTWDLDYKTGLIRVSTWKDYAGKGCLRIFTDLIERAFNVTTRREAKLVFGGGLGRYKIKDGIDKERLLVMLTK